MLSAKSLQPCPTQPCPTQPTRLPRPWDSPGKNTGVGGHFLLPCMKVKSENEVAQSCPTLPNPMNSGAWDFPGKSTGVGCHRLLRSRLVVGSHSAETPLLLTEIFIGLMLGGREDTRGDGFAFLTYQGSPLELLCCCFILLSPALFIFHPAALTFFLQC